MALYIVLALRFCDTLLLSFAGAVAAANPGLLKALNQMETDEERMLFVSQLHKVIPMLLYGSDELMR